MSTEDSQVLLIFVVAIIFGIIAMSKSTISRSAMVVTAILLGALYWYVTQRYLNPLALMVGYLIGCEIYRFRWRNAE